MELTEVFQQRICFLYLLDIKASVSRKMLTIVGRDYEDEWSRPREHTCEGAWGRMPKYT